MEDEEECLQSNEDTIESIRIPIQSGIAAPTPGSATSRTLSRASHPASRVVGVSELDALGFHNRNDYWEHSAFGSARITAVCLAGLASICLFYSFGATTWVYTGNRELRDHCRDNRYTCYLNTIYTNAIRQK